MLDPLKAFLDALSQKPLPAAPVEDNEPSFTSSEGPALYTTHEATIPGFRVSRVLPLISARSVIGVPIAPETVLSMFQSCHKEAGKLETALCRLESEVLLKLRSLAAERNCQAVVGLNVQFGDAASTSLVQYVFAAAQGTPVQLEPDQSVPA